MNYQEIFNTAYKTIITQGFPAMDPIKKDCVYFDAETGRMCSIGQVLGEKLSHKLQILLDKKENKGTGDITTVLKKFGHMFPKDFLEEDNLYFLRKLQSAHDIAAYNAEDENENIDSVIFLEDFDKQMKIIASKFNLKYSKDK